MTDAAAVAIEKLTGQIAALKDMDMEAKAKAKADMDEKEKEMAAKDAEIATLKANALTDAALDARVAARADLISKATAIAKDVATVGAVGRRNPQGCRYSQAAMRAVAGKADAYIDARFDILVEGIKDADPIAKMKDAAPVKAGDRQQIYTDFADGFAAAHPSMKEEA
ncbi:MAG: hypothetical protein U5N55_10655 [Cypionkella sp.]|nr:hypothetical protein [Cypionkella sp.]